MRTELQLLIANDVAEQKSSVYDLFIFYWKLVFELIWLLIHWSRLLLFFVLVHHHWLLLVVMMLSLADFYFVFLFENNNWWRSHYWENKIFKL